MSQPGSITYWLNTLRAGESVAALKLWENYFQRLVNLARNKLRLVPRAAADEEDVALSAFDSFCRGVEQGRFPRLDDRDDLWQILFLLTERKAIDLIQHEGREKRDWRKAQPLAGDNSPRADLAGREPDPAFAAEVAEQCRHLLNLLPNDDFRLLAVRKMEGHTNEECAALLDWSRAKVERRLGIIREVWNPSPE